MQLPYLVARLPVVREVQQPVGAVRLDRVDEEGRVEARPRPRLDVAVEPVLDEVAPAFPSANLHRGHDPRQAAFQGRVGRMRSRDRPRGASYQGGAAYSRAAR